MLAVTNGAKWAQCDTSTYGLACGYLLVLVIVTAMRSLIIVWNGEGTERGSQSGGALEAVLSFLSLRGTLTSPPPCSYLTALLGSDDYHGWPLGCTEMVCAEELCRYLGSWTGFAPVVLGLHPRVAPAFGFGRSETAGKE